MDTKNASMKSICYGTVIPTILSPFALFQYKTAVHAFWKPLGQKFRSVSTEGHAGVRSKHRRFQLSVVTAMAISKWHVSQNVDFSDAQTLHLPFPHLDK